MGPPRDLVGRVPAKRSERATADRLLPLVRSGQYARFFWGAAVSNSGTWMQQLTVPFAVYEITGSKAWLGTAALIGQLPSLVGNMLAGAVADRLDRKRLLVCSQAVLVVLTVALWALWSSGHHALGPLLALVFVLGFANGFNAPVWQAFIPLLVEPRQITAAVRLNSLQFSSARVVGPVCAGIVLEHLGAGAAFLANGILKLPVLAIIVTLRPRSVLPQPRLPVVAQIRDGWSYVIHHGSLLLATVTILCVSMLGWSILALLPAIARDVFHVPATQIGWLSAGYGTGMLAGVAAAATFLQLRRSTLAQLAMGCWIAGMALLVAVSSMTLGLAAFFLMGIGHVLVGQSAQVCVQVQVDEEYRGRVISAYFQGVFLGSPVGAFVLGGVSGWIGIRGAICVSAAGMVALFAVVVLRFGAFRSWDGDEPDPRRRPWREPLSYATAP